MDTVKIGFTFSKTSALKKRTSEEQRDYVTDISDNKITSVFGNGEKAPLVIPFDNQGVSKRSKTQQAPVEARVISHNAPQPIDPSVPRSIDQLAVDALIADARNEVKPLSSEPIDLPILLKNQIDGIQNIVGEDERFKFDVSSRPEEADLAAYEAVPVSEFGYAMLRGQGWEVGQPIGKTNKGVIPVYEYVRRAGLHTGLGATPKDVIAKKKKYIKPGESREVQPHMVMPVGPDGKVRHVKTLDEKLVPLRVGLFEGCLVGVVSGQHEGLFGRITQIDKDNDNIVVRLAPSSEEVVVSKSEVTKVDASSLSSEHPALKAMKSSSSSKSKTREPPSPEAKQWIRPNIMIRIVSKSFKSGRLYNKKGFILDVVGRNLCTVRLEDGSLVEDVRQKDLETVLPKIGGRVMIVGPGPECGQIGILVERSKAGREEEAVVQIVEDLTLHNFILDDVSLYAEM